MRPLFLLTALAGCQPNLALQDDFERPPIALFSAAQDSLNSPYLAGTDIRVRVRGLEDRTDVELVSTDPSVVVVDSVDVALEDGILRRRAVLRAVGPGEATLQVVVGRRTRHEATVVVAAPDQVHIVPILAVAAESFTGIPTRDGGLDPIHILQNSEVEFEVRAFANGEQLTGTPIVDVVGDGLTVEPGSFRSVDTSPIVAVSSAQAGEQDVVFRVGGTDVSVPVHTHVNVHDLAVQPLPCDQTGPQLNACYLVVDARTEDDAPLYGVFPEWSTATEDDWSSLQPGDVLRYALPGGEPPAGTPPRTVAMELVVGEQSFTTEVDLDLADSQALDDALVVEHSNDIAGCSHTGGGAVWLGGLAGLLALSRRRRQDGPAQRASHDRSD